MQDGLTGSAWGDWANYTASPLRWEVDMEDIADRKKHDENEGALALAEVIA